MICVIFFVSLLFHAEAAADCTANSTSELEQCIGNCLSPTEETLDLKKIQNQNEEISNDLAVLSQSKLLIKFIKFYICFYHILLTYV